MARSRAFSVPKRGRAEAENEDAWEIDRERAAVAVADGATESSFSRAWARLLVDSVRLWPLDAEAGPEALLAWLGRPQAMWQRLVQGRPLPWHAQHKVARGAFAALVAAELRADDAGVSWSALGVGDCCMFVVEDDRLVRAFPIEDPEAFGSTPFLLGTNPEANRDLAAHFRRARGRAARGALFFFMTDALAQWFLRSTQAGERPWARLRELGDQSAFAELVGRLRAAGALRNDDSTLVIWEA
ncbi:MAG TPA: protein phosphatase 2C domain-containing protein [Thermodesulfobacteriota bacterium]|nr:protein phosphatase 2C domain-containing protein [Thermodesulfobacteriota bacterium]